MSAVGTFVLVHGFSALLPPIPEDETGYYEILEVPSSASTDDIRRAYKKKSLMLHPDKVAQRGGGGSGVDPETAKAQYQKVQEAHAVLADEGKRRNYNLLGKSPTRYQFVSRGLNPGAMYENLTKAGVCEKTRLVFLVTLVMCLVLLQPILICSKVNHVVEMKGALEYAKWTYILIPWWILSGLVVVVSFLIFIVSKRVTFLISFCEHACWFVGEFLLALSWDGTMTQEYVIVFIPVYMALFFRWAHKIVQLKEIRTALTHMVTMDYIEKHVLDNGRHYADLTEEERHDIHQKYVVVHATPDAARGDEGEDGDEDEEERVQASPEYQHAVESYTTIMNNLIAGVVVCTTFVALVVAKVDGRISVSWWVVFVPIWVKIGSEILASTCACCCMPVVGDVVIVGELDKEPEESKSNAEKGEDFKRNADPAFSDVEASIRIGQQSGSKDANDVEVELGGPNENDEKPIMESEVEEDAPADEKDSELKSLEPTTKSDEKKGSPEDEKKGEDAPADEKDSERKSLEPTTKSDAKKGSPEDEKQGESKSAETPTKESEEAELAAKLKTAVPEEEGKSQDGTQDYAATDDHEFVFDEDMFREWESARQEAEASAMEAHAKAQANCCGALFQLTIICLIVGKLQQDYQRDPDEEPGYNAFWILFPFLLIFGCVFLLCACCIYSAGESEGFDHLVERRMSTNKPDEDRGDEEAPADQQEATDGEAAVESKDKTDLPDDNHAPTVTEQVSEIHDLD